MGLLPSRRRILSTGVLLVALALAAGSSAAALEQKPSVGGTAVVGQDQEPTCLNLYHVNCSFLPTRLVTSPVLAGAYRQRPNLSFEPVLVDRVTVRPATATSRFKLTYRLEPGAEWSDGTPVSAHDLVFTLETLLAPANQVSSRDGYNRIIETTVLDEKTARFTFDRPYPAWKALFPVVLPKHVLEGESFSTFWSNGIVHPDTGEPIGSGPFLWESWDPAAQVTLSRNPNWWGAHAPFLDSLVIRFIPALSEQVQALTNGLVDVITPFAAQPALAGTPGIEFQSSPATLYEHVDFNVGPGTKPLLGERWFRKAVAYALDREGATSAVAQATNSPDHGVLQSLTHFSQHPYYKEDFDRYSYDPERVSRIMRRHGCTLGGDGIWSCGGTRASIRFATTTGNLVRETIQSHVQASARAAGIELVTDNSSPPILLGQRLPARDFDAVLFTFITGGNGFGLDPLFVCNGASNFMGYCSEAVTRMLDEANEESREGRRRSLIHRAGAILADDVASIPILQRPTFLYSRTRLRGIEDNPSLQQGLTWNVEEWWIADE
jgi:peptide/nickel transport system substrate-binding protein